ncbi:MAG: hypothetical protein KDA20_02120 [Phycisphaerales bacterium]|nr:hypothetical protein [Phycisphaerales bacterium]
MVDASVRFRSVRTPLRFQHIRGLLALLMLAPTLLHIGWHEPILPPTVLWAIQLGMLGAYTVLFALDVHRVRAMPATHRTDLVSILRPEFIAIALSLLFCWSWIGLAIMSAPLALIFAVRSFLRLAQSRIPSGLIFVGSFVVLTIAGTALLMLPAAAPKGAPIGVLDAAFTITSAVSQTGLVVRPTGVVVDTAGAPIAGFTRLGQIIILVWIQVGALGVLVFGALVASLVGSGFGLRATQTLAEGTEQGWEGQLSAQRLVTFVILATHIIELIGAVFIYFTWPKEWAGMPHDFASVGDRAYHAVFMSVSAFCNAGFSTTTDSMASLRTHVMPHAIIFPLIIFGSIGYAVLENVWRVLVAKARRRRTEGGVLVRLSLHSKLVMTSALIVYLLGVVIIMIGEAVQTDEPWRLIVLDAHFMSINRTTGFNTIDVNAMGGLSRLALIFLMFVGAAPGSVASGVKLIVVSVLALTVWGTIRGREQTTAFGRTIPEDIVRKCAALAIACLLVVLGSTAGLVLTEENNTALSPSLEVLLFESTSAFGNTGLSMGITDKLTVAGKINIIITMFVGRVGVFATLAALASVGARRRPRIEYPGERVSIY